MYCGMLFTTFLCKGMIFFNNYVCLYIYTYNLGLIILLQLAPCDMVSPPNLDKKPTCSGLPVLLCLEGSNSGVFLICYDYLVPQAVH